MHIDGDPDLAKVLTDPARIRDLRAEDIPALLGTLEQVRATLWARMVREPALLTRDPEGDGGEQLLTVTEAAAELKFTPGYVYDAVRRGQLPAIRKGKYVRLRRLDLRAWLDGRSPRGLDPQPAHSDSSSLHAAPPFGRHPTRPDALKRRASLPVAVRRRSRTRVRPPDTAVSGAAPRDADPHGRDAAATR